MPAPRKRRKLVALVAILAAIIVCWIERGEISALSGEGWFWLASSGFAVLLATLELLGVGETRHEP